MWLREHGRVYSAGSPVDTGEIALYKNYSLLLLLNDVDMCEMAKICGYGLNV